MVRKVSYKTSVFFPLMNRAIGDRETGKLRTQLLAQACGEILEIGFGSGLNLSHYPATVRSLVAIDPIQVAVPIVPGMPQVQFKVMSAEALQFPAASFDTVVSTFTLCSVDSVPQTLQEVSRVLKPGGKLLFLEHGKSWIKPLAWLQNLLNPFYVILACGCHVNRDIASEIANTRLQVEHVQRLRFANQPVSGFFYQGAAYAAPGIR